jgi:hypothetical protein
MGPPIFQWQSGQREDLGADETAEQPKTEALAPTRSMAFDVGPDKPGGAAAFVTRELEGRLRAPLG